MHLQKNLVHAKIDEKIQPQRGDIPINHEADKLKPQRGGIKKLEMVYIKS